MSEKYWFPAKRYGWGWGFPSTWQGWLVFGVFLALVAAGFALFRAFPQHEALVAFLIYIVILSGVFVAICWLKGEPPRWRWG
jgi:uncharacterized membrane protein HdeD (DUF308 family)